MDPIRKQCFLARRVIKNLDFRRVDLCLSPRFLGAKLGNVEFKFFHFMWVLNTCLAIYIYLRRHAHSDRIFTVPYTSVRLASL